MFSGHPSRRGGQEEVIIKDMAGSNCGESEAPFTGGTVYYNVMLLCTVCVHV